MNYPTRFKPARQQIEAAQNLFFAMALHKVISNKISDIQATVLADGSFHYDTKWYDTRHDDLPADRILVDPKHDYMIDGMTDLDKPEYKGSDCERYYQRVRELALQEGFINGENADCMLSNQVMKCENALIEEAFNYHFIPLDKLSSNMEYRKKLLDLLTNLFSSTIKTKDMDQKQRAFYDQHIQELEAAN